MIWQLYRLYGWYLQRFRPAALDRDEQTIRDMQHRLARQNRFESWENER